LITVYDDAPEQKKLEGIIIVVNAYRLRYIASFGAYAPPNSKLYFRAVGEPWFEDMAGFSPKVNILSLAAYKRA